MGACYLPSGPPTVEHVSRWLELASAALYSRSDADLEELAVINPAALSGSTIQCPDARQTLTYPPGWTWVKCSCPETEKPAPANSR